MYLRGVQFGTRSSIPDERSRGEKGSSIRDSRCPRSASSRETEAKPGQRSFHLINGLYTSKSSQYAPIYDEVDSVLLYIHFSSMRSMLFI